MYFDERMKISDEKEKPLFSRGFSGMQRRKKDGYLQGKDRKLFHILYITF